MKVIEHLEKAKNPLFSYEIVPPPRGRSIQDIIDIVEAVKPYNPPWIDVTAHSAGAYYNERLDGIIERRITKKRPGTVGICGIIQNRYNIDTVTHLLCQGFTKEETEDALIELNYLGIKNVLALKGDGLNYERAIDKGRTINQYASDLVAQVDELRKGQYIDELVNSRPLDFCVGVAGYPEKHFESPNLKQDIQYLKQKVDNGADYITTQIFLDNTYYFKFVEMCRAAGINVPIIPGIKVIKKASQLKSISKKFYIDFPDGLVDEINKNPNHTEEIGINWAVKQTEGLLAAGVPCVHYYIINDTSSVLEVVRKFH